VSIPPIIMEGGGMIVNSDVNIGVAESIIIIGWLK
jgi:hypothetical protein